MRAAFSSNVSDRADADDDADTLLDADTEGAPFGESCGIARSHATSAKTISTHNTLTLQDVLFGDVILCAGQSNMQFSVTGLANQSRELSEAGAYADRIRLFQVGMDTSCAHPLAAAGGAAGGATATLVVGDIALRDYSRRRWRQGRRGGAPVGRAPRRRS